MPIIPHWGNKGKITIKSIAAPLINMATGFPLVWHIRHLSCLVMYSSTLSDLYFVRGTHPTGHG